MEGLFRDGNGDAIIFFSEAHHAATKQFQMNNMHAYFHVIVLQKSIDFLICDRCPMALFVPLLRI